MPVMLAKTYAALMAAGAPEEAAQAAAEELADYEARFGSIDTRLGRIEGGIAAMRSELHSEIAGMRSEFRSEIVNVRSEIAGVRSEAGGLRSEMKTRFAVLTWAMGIDAAATTAILGVLLRH